MVGIRGHRPLVDGGFVTTPEFAKYTLDSQWSAMENHGVDPDIEVQKLPEDAVAEILKKIAAHPMTLPPPPSKPPKGQSQ